MISFCESLVFPRKRKIMFSPSQITNGLNYNQTPLNSFCFFMVKDDSDGEFSRMPCMNSVPENRRGKKNTSKLVTLKHPCCSSLSKLRGM